MTLTAKARGFSFFDFFLYRGGATGALDGGFCLGLVLAMTSGSCSACFPVPEGPAPVEDSVNVLGYFFELCVDSESRELDDNAETDTAFRPPSTVAQ